jgi:hypothetical protein
MSWNVVGMCNAPNERPRDNIGYGNMSRRRAGACWHVLLVCC